MNKLLIRPSAILRILFSTFAIILALQFMPTASFAGVTVYTATGDFSGENQNALPINGRIFIAYDIYATTYYGPDHVLGYYFNLLDPIGVYSLAQAENFPAAMVTGNTFTLGITPEKFAKEGSNVEQLPAQGFTLYVFFTSKVTGKQVPAVAQLCATGTMNGNNGVTKNVTIITNQVNINQKTGAMTLGPVLDAQKFSPTSGSIRYEQN